MSEIMYETNGVIHTERDEIDRLTAECDKLKKDLELEQIAGRAYDELRIECERLKEENIVIADTFSLLQKHHFSVETKFKNLQDKLSRYEAADEFTSMMDYGLSLTVPLNNKIEDLQAKLDRAEESLRDSQAKLVRYEQATEVEGYVGDKGTDYSYIYNIALPKDWHEKRVRVIVMEE